MPYKLCDKCSRDTKDCPALKGGINNREEECLKFPGKDGFNKEEFFKSGPLKQTEMLVGEK